MQKKPTRSDSVRYTGGPPHKVKQSSKSIEVVGLDTEAYDTGECFLVCLSDGAVFHPSQLLDMLITRKYRNTNFVAFNLRYDSGALLQQFPIEVLDTLRRRGKVKHGDWTISYIPHKLLSFSHGKKTAKVWDMLNYYQCSLERAADRYLGEHKDDIETKSFSHAYVEQNRQRITDYCLQDARLVQRLAQHLIQKFESLGIYPTKLYSTAYVSFQYFRSKCIYPTVRRYWDNDRRVLDYAMQAYQGGKFEVTEKGIDYYYEYDIVSAYPNEIAQLVDIQHARVVWSKRYRKGAIYGFVDATLSIPPTTYSPAVVVRGGINTYPVGEVRRVITKVEYEYLIGAGADVTIHSGIWLHVDSDRHPFKAEVNKLVRHKERAKESGDALLYHTAKILMNSLYGKMVQLIDVGDAWKAGTSWNPIYGAHITAAVRCRISALQQQYRSIVAVHTDSVISKSALPFAKSRELGDIAYETEGNGLILGSGVYQVGEKIALRGFGAGVNLLDLCAKKVKRVPIETLRPISWREATFRGLDIERINRFEHAPRHLDVAFDTKRIWLDDYTRFSDIPNRKVKSVPLIACPALA